VGCHPNLAIAMYAVDSLRQLAMKFLERDELANYTFQNDFLRPFVVVMRQSTALEIRELIIRCLSQVHLTHVGCLHVEHASDVACHRASLPHVQFERHSLHACRTQTCCLRCCCAACAA
jgi:hypothetical protein